MRTYKRPKASKGLTADFRGSKIKEIEVSHELGQESCNVKIKVAKGYLIFNGVQSIEGSINIKRN